MILLKSICLNCRKLIFIFIRIWSCRKAETAVCGYDYIIVAARTMDNKDISACVFPGDNSDVGQIAVKG